MGYKALYDFAQGLTPRVSRKNLRNKALELCNVRVIQHAIVTMDITVCRGMYITPGNPAHRISEQLGTHVICTARGMNDCWERFVYTKELMHLFGSSKDAADNGEKFETQLNELATAGANQSAQTKAELDCFWMGLALLCPEKRRLEFEQLKTGQAIDDYTIALELKIPQQYVGRLFEPRYRVIVDRILAEDPSPDS